MAWVERIHQVLGYLVTAAEWNQQVDNEIYLGNSHDHATAVGAGSGGQAFHVCVVRSDAAQTIADSTWTARSFNEDITDADGLHSPVTNNTRITIAKTGKYLLWQNGVFDSNATGRRGAGFAVDGVQLVGNYMWYAAINGVATPVLLSMPLSLTAGQYVEAMVYQNSTGALDVGPGTDGEFGVIWIGA